jgi:hypothetical protein
VTLASLLLYMLFAGLVLALLLWRGRRWACLLLGHEVGVARVEAPNAYPGATPVSIRTSRCIRCRRVFSDLSEDSEAA